MRRIAAALDTGPASLYVYVRDTADLHAQILDHLLGSVPAPAGGDWRERLRSTLTAYRDVLFRHPEMARMALTTQPNGPHYLALADRILALLDEAGGPGRDAAWAVDLLLLYPTAIAAERAGRPRSDAEISALTSSIATAGARVYPALAAVGPALLSGAGPERFAYAL